MAGNYLYSIDIALGMTSNLEKTVYERVCIGYMQILCYFMYGTLAFTYFGIHRGSLNQYPHGYRGTTVHVKHYEDNQFCETILSTRGQCLYAIPFALVIQIPPISRIISVRTYHSIPFSEVVSYI